MWYPAHPPLRQQNSGSMINSSQKYVPIMPPQLFPPHASGQSVYSTGPAAGGTGYFHNSAFYGNQNTNNSLHVETTPFSLRDNRSHRQSNGHLQNHRDQMFNQPGSHQRDRSAQRRFQKNLSGVQLQNQFETSAKAKDQSNNTMMLTQENLEILNKQHHPSKDMLYAKIFTD